ncbi:MAG: LysR family transcriptional regulator [Enterocloster sp.]
MDFRQLEYILKIAEENNITRAAEKLFISQSALNQQLLKLEKELGCQLFHRSRTDWHLTEAGRIYVEGAKKALLLKKETYNQINDAIQSKKCQLTVGLTPGRGIRMFTAIYPLLHKDFDRITVTPMEMSVRSQQEAIAKGDLDLGFMTLCSRQRTNDTYISLGSEEMIVIIPKLHPLSRLAAPAGEPLAVIDIRLLQFEPFVMMYKTSTNRQLCDGIFERAGFKPNVLFETSSTPSIWAMVQSALCCGILPRYYVDLNDENISCFVLKDHPTWDLCISYRKNSYVSNGAKEFIRLAREYWTEHLTPPQTNQ